MMNDLLMKSKTKSEEQHLLNDHRSVVDVGTSDQSEAPTLKRRISLQVDGELHVVRMEQSKRHEHENRHRLKIVVGRRRRNARL